MTDLWLNKKRDFYHVIITMEHQFGVVESVQVRGFDPGSDRYTAPAAYLLDDYVSDRRRRGKIERKAEIVKPVKNKSTVSGYARQYCDKEKNTYYYKTLEHIPQLYDTRNGQPPGKIVPERLFKTLIKAGQTPINNNFMRITGRSQAEDPRVRFNPADYMTSATTGQSEGYGTQKPVNTGKRTIFGQEVVPAVSGKDPSKPDPGVPPPPPNGPSGSDDDDDDTSGGGGGRTGLLNYISEWYTAFKERVNNAIRSPQSTALEPYQLPPPANEGAVVPYQQPQFDSDQRALVPYRPPSDTSQGTFSQSSDMLQVIRQTPVEDFQPVPVTTRRSGRNRNVLYPDLNEDNMASRSSSAILNDYTRDYRPERRDAYLLDDHPSFETISKKNRDDDDDPKGNVFQNDRANAFQNDQKKPADTSENEFQNGGKGLTEEQMEYFMQKFSKKFEEDIQKIIDKIEKKGEADKNDVEEIQQTWYNAFKQVVKSIADNNVVNFFVGINKMRSAFNGLVFIGQLMGTAGLGYMVYRGYTNVRDKTREVYDETVTFAGNMGKYFEGKRPPKYRISRDQARKMIDKSGSKQSVAEQVKQLGLLFGDEIDLRNVLSVDETDKTDPWWTMNERAYGHPGLGANIALGVETIRQGLLRRDGFKELSRDEVRFLQSKMSGNYNEAQSQIDSALGIEPPNKGRSRVHYNEQNMAIIGGLVAALYMGPTIFRRLARKFMRSSGQPLPNMPNTSNLAEQSEAIENAVRGNRRSGRKRKQVYTSLNENEMSQKAGKQKMYTEDGI